MAKIVQLLLPGGLRFEGAVIERTDERRIETPRRYWRTATGPQGPGAGLCSGGAGAKLTLARNFGATSQASNPAVAGQASTFPSGFESSGPLPAGPRAASWDNSRSVRLRRSCGEQAPHPIVSHDIPSNHRLFKFFFTTKTVPAYGHPSSLCYDATGQPPALRPRPVVSNRAKSCLCTSKILKAEIWEKANENEKIKPN
jgi:hypothetical protein